MKGLLYIVSFIGGASLCFSAMQHGIPPKSAAGEIKSRAAFSWASGTPVQREGKWVLTECDEALEGLELSLEHYGNEAPVSGKRSWLGIFCENESDYAQFVEYEVMQRRFGGFDPVPVSKKFSKPAFYIVSYVPKSQVPGQY